MAPRRRTYRPPVGRGSVRRRTALRAGSARDNGILLLVGAVIAIAVVSAILGFIAEHPVLTGLLLAATAAVAALVVARQRRARRQAREVQAARSRHIAGYLTMDDKEFERALAFLCERDGCRNVQVVGGAGDLAADVIATVPDGRRIVIQAKRFAPTTKVGSPDVQKVNGTYRDVHGGHLAAVVTTSVFTKSALAFGKQVGIRMYDRQALAGWASGTGPAPWH
ncbi:restriction endonuclease [Kitasatospora sp. GP82]|uniref:restriction endonuclease n=1 Tax=Kitasatospora sp. GP82 TaxID=3035089 RepID=UPI0024749574|nr:restriction endonuclease [Kitasatospora sp. GP82]MDH6125053.1 restriction system protein [Kitasatospora sp. GP82]